MIPPLTVEEEKLVDLGFVPTKNLGITFPGVNEKKFNFEKNSAKLEKIPEPTLKIGPVS